MSQLPFSKPKVPSRDIRKAGKDKQASKIVELQRLLAEASHKIALSVQRAAAINAATAAATASALQCQAPLWMTQCIARDVASAIHNLASSDTYVLVPAQLCHVGSQHDSSSEAETQARFDISDAASQLPGAEAAPAAADDDSLDDVPFLDASLCGPLPPAMQRPTHFSLFTDEESCNGPEGCTGADSADAAAGAMQEAQRSLVGATAIPLDLPLPVVGASGWRDDSFSSSTSLVPALDVVIPSAEECKSFDYNDYEKSDAASTRLTGEIAFKQCGLLSSGLPAAGNVVIACDPMTHGNGAIAEVDGSADFNSLSPLFGANGSSATDGQCLQDNQFLWKPKPLYGKAAIQPHVAEKDFDSHNFAHHHGPMTELLQAQPVLFDAIAAEKSDTIAGVIESDSQALAHTNLLQVGPLPCHPSTSSLASPSGIAQDNLIYEAMAIISRSNKTPAEYKRRAGL